MANDWQIGDLAVCIGPSGHPGAWTPKTGPIPKKGLICRVAGIVARGDWVALVIEGFPAPHWTGGWSSRCFRKIRPDAHEACETEFVTLLKRAKRPVSA